MGRAPFLKLAELDPDEIRALNGEFADGAAFIASRIRSQLSAALPHGVRLNVRVRTASALPEGVPDPSIQADNNLLAAWVAARFGAEAGSLPVPEHHARILLQNIRHAFAEAVLKQGLGKNKSLALEIELGSQGGMLDIDWSRLDEQSLKQWAVKQWTAMQGEHP
jgi:hypothetical protein